MSLCSKRICLPQCFRPPRAGPQTRAQPGAALSILLSVIHTAAAADETGWLFASVAASITRCSFASDLSNSSLIFPPAKTANLSHIARSSGSSEEIIPIEIPCSTSHNIILYVLFLAPTSTSLVGSSSRKILGSPGSTLIHEYVSVELQPSLDRVQDFTTAGFHQAGNAQDFDPT